ncbi:MAG: pyridoxal phosphate-dependent aminotransferase [Fidelibacterota bacterium]
MKDKGEAMYVAKRMSRLGTETAFEVLARAKSLEAQGKNIIHLEIGEPDFNTPANIIEAAKQALSDGYTHYGPAAGDVDLRDVIVDEIKKTRGIDITPDNIVITPGAKPIMFFVILSCVEEGDEVIYPNPGFPIYESMIRYIGADPIPIPLLEERDFSFNVEDLKQLVSRRTRMMIINSPQNPTGGTLSREDLLQIAEIAVANDIIVMSDEVYSRIIYDGQHHSIFSIEGMKDRTVLIEGFSKTFAMTGWRLGYGVMPEHLAFHITKLMVNSNSCTCSFTQRAGIEALTGPQDEVFRMVEEFKKRRNVIVEGLNRLPGFSCVIPKGAFYVFPNIKKTGMKSRELADFLMEKANVACLSGTAFGEYGEGYLRFSYANSIENIKRALERIESSMNTI